ncbi:MAG: hypothetical protein ACJ8C4_09215 [Gemmataceae bacterium]
MIQCAFRATLGAFVATFGLVATANASPVLAAPFAGTYTITNIGLAAGVPTSIAGLTEQISNSNALLIGGNANTPSGAIYSIGLTRNAGGHISGFSGSASVFASASNIDAGLAYGPSNVLFATTYNDNKILQYKSGSTTPDKIINLTSLGLDGSTGGLAFVPSGFTGAGSLWISSYLSGKMYRADVVPDGLGTFNITNVSNIATLPTLLENFAWVPNSAPIFSSSSQHVLTALGSPNSVMAYSLNANGFPTTANGQTFISGFTNVPVGMSFDYLTGDLLISEWSVTGAVYVVSGFTPVPEPSSLLLAGWFATGVIAAWRTTQRKLRSCSSQ